MRQNSHFWQWSVQIKKILQKNSMKFPFGTMKCTDHNDNVPEQGKIPIWWNFVYSSTVSLCIVNLIIPNENFSHFGNYGHVPWKKTKKNPTALPCLISHEWTFDTVLPGHPSTAVGSLTCPCLQHLGPRSFASFKGLGSESRYLENWERVESTTASTGIQTRSLSVVLSPGSYS